MEAVLIVEDSAEIAALMALTLRMEGYEVMQASNGAQALELVRERRPALILLDVMMPGLNGFQVAQALKNDPNTQDTPIIFVTARHETTDLVQGLELAVDYISKPFAVPELIARVRAALRVQKMQAELKASNEQLSRLAVTDGLTGLFNRRGFDQQFEDEVWRARRFNHALGLAIFDLDRFKLVNDSYGHAQGDVVLQTFAQTLLESSRRVDKVARFGGEEFALLLPATDMEGARTVSEKVRVATEELEIPCPTCDGKLLKVTTSGGCVVIPELSGSNNSIPDLAAGLFELADRGLYEAKQGGRNRIVMQVASEAEVTQIGMLSRHAS